MLIISRKASRLCPCRGALGTAWQKINRKSQMFCQDTSSINRKPPVKIGDLIDSFNICKNRVN
jgi:hypothetical protein